MVEVKINLSKYEEFTTRTIRKNTRGNPFLCLCKELSWINARPGDKVLIGTRDESSLEIIIVKETETEGEDDEE